MTGETGPVHDLIGIETARAVADTVIGLNDHLAGGGGVSGPRCPPRPQGRRVPLVV
ncbi:hypothetical protein [Nonomuraea sp. NPDC049480]|uniref:hypothetical protein n=1 Tax=Nonomuraea sp. NPDC049480 TaxID=3364353 RepID=UPI0037A4A5A5